MAICVQWNTVLYLSHGFFFVYNLNQSFDLNNIIVAVVSFFKGL